MPTVHLYASARAAAGTNRLEVTAATAAEVVAALCAGRPAHLAEVLSVCTLLADGQRLDPTSTDPLPAGAAIEVLPPFAGG